MFKAFTGWQGESVVIVGCDLTSGQMKPNSFSTGRHLRLTDRHMLPHGPMGMGTLSVHMGTYTEHRKN